MKAAPIAMCVLVVAALASPLLAQFSGATSLTSETYNIRSSTTIRYRLTLDEFWLCGCTLEDHHFLQRGTDVKSEDGNGIKLSSEYMWTSLLYQTKYPGSCYSSHSWAWFYPYLGERVQSTRFYAPQNPLCVPLPEEPPPPEDRDPSGDPCDLCSSPILIDIDSDGYALTSATQGVLFDIDGDGTLDRIGWTSRDDDDAFLWLDANGNGVVESGLELFGSAEYSNGFIKLAAFDSLVRGGNRDGRIDPQDRVWTQLLLWRDSNHNGISEASEISPLSSARFTALSTEFQTIGKRDQYGNLFRYMGRIDQDTKNTKAAKIFDVIFVRTEL